MSNKGSLKHLPLSDIEWTTLWMAIRYAMNGQTIASAMLPQDIVRTYYRRLTNAQKASIVTDLKQNEEDVLRISDGRQKAFGHPEIDRPHWLRFIAALDIENHFNVLMNDGSIITCFQVGDRYYYSAACRHHCRTERITGKGISKQERKLYVSGIYRP